MSGHLGSACPGGDTRLQTAVVGERLSVLWLLADSDQLREEISPVRHQHLLEVFDVLLVFKGGPVCQALLVCRTEGQVLACGDLHEQSHHGSAGSTKMR